MEVKNMVEKKLYCLSENQKWTLGRNTSDEGASGVGSEGNEVHVFGNVDEKESLLHNCKKFSWNCVLQAMWKVELVSNELKW